MECKIGESLIKRKLVPNIQNFVLLFQYKLIYNILTTRSYLFKLKITDTNTCGICGNSVETIQHLFTQCSIVQTLWSSNLKWIREKINQNYVLSEINKLFGYLVRDQNFLSMNKTIHILVCKKEIIAEFGSSENNIKRKIL